MSHRFLTAITGTMLVSIAALSVPTASFGSTAGLAQPAQPSIICQGNTNVADDTGHALPAQFYGVANPLDTKGAVLIRVNTPCVLDYITAYGIRTGSGSVTAVNIEIKNDAVGGPNGHEPGTTILQSSTNNPATGTASGPYYVVNSTFPAYTLTPGVFYWVQMQVKLPPRTRSTWSWEVVRPDPSGNGDVWRNPNGGWSCGFNWKRVSLSCMGSAPGKGLMTELGT